MKGGKKHEAGKSASDAAALFYYVQRIDEEKTPARLYLNGSNILLSELLKYR
jgi:hypothetical protein